MDSADDRVAQHLAYPLCRQEVPPLPFSLPLLSKIKKVSLPPLTVWDLVVNKESSVLIASLDVEIAGKWPLLFGSKLDRNHYNCVIGRESGYLVVYKDRVTLAGYALYIASAKKISLKRRINTATKNKDQTTTAKICIEWGFGKITIRLDNCEGEAGRQQLHAILEACQKPCTSGDVEVLLRKPTSNASPVLSPQVCALPASPVQTMPSPSAEVIPHTLNAAELHSLFAGLFAASTMPEPINVDAAIEPALSLPSTDPAEEEDSVGDVTCAATGGDEEKDG